MVLLLVGPHLLDERCIRQIMVYLRYTVGVCRAEGLWIFPTTCVCSTKHKGTVNLAWWSRVHTSTANNKETFTVCISRPHFLLNILTCTLNCRFFDRDSTSRCSFQKYKESLKAVHNWFRKQKKKHTRDCISVIAAPSSWPSAMWSCHRLSLQNIKIPPSAGEMLAISFWNGIKGMCSSNFNFQNEKLRLSSSACTKEPKWFNIFCFREDSPFVLNIPQPWSLPL